jgi:hypothetical protein
MTTEEKSATASALDALVGTPPPADKKRRGSVRAAVAESLQTLLRLRAEGYTDAQLADVMTTAGTQIKAGTLKVYINELRVEHEGPRRSGSKPEMARKPTDNRGGHAAQTSPVASSRPTERPKLSDTAARPVASGKAAIRGHDFSGDA